METNKENARAKINEWTGPIMLLNLALQIVILCQGGCIRSRQSAIARRVLDIEQRIESLER